MTSTYKYLFGPVFSWRLGMSLGIDPLSTDGKVCSYNCIYCQLGAGVSPQTERREFVATREVIKEIKTLPKVHIDYLTFSGCGEPTLASNLGEMIEVLRQVRDEKIAVITNSSLMAREDVRKDLSLADCVLAKLDASTQEVFDKINRPQRKMNLRKIIKGIKAFKKDFRGKLALQIMFVHENKVYAQDIAKAAEQISPDEIQLNTPLRRCAVRPLDREEMQEIQKFFKGFSVVSVYDVEKRNVLPFSSEETARRHGEM